MISINNLNKSFGGVKAVNNASLKIEDGSITGLIGPNGAGKTTLFNIIAGLHKLQILEKCFLNDEEITELPPHILFKKGLLRTFQIPHEFHLLLF